MRILFFFFMFLIIYSCNSVKPNTEKDLAEKEDINLLGVYEYVYEHNTEDFIENHYLEFQSKKAFYYGTSDDFDNAREGYYPGYFMTEIENFKMNRNKFSFTLNVTDSLFYKTPITPLYQVNGYQPWGNSIRYNLRSYKGEINGDTITIITDDFDPRKFIKKNVSDKKINQ